MDAAAARAGPNHRSAGPAGRFVGVAAGSKRFPSGAIVITEPAIGYGGGVAALFFRESIREREARVAESGRKSPPDVFAIVGAGTENGTKAGAAGGMWSSPDDDRWRWRGGIARMNVNLDFFGVGGGLEGIGYNLDGWVSVQQGMMRLGRSDTWLVARWNWLDLQNRFNAEKRAGPRSTCCPASNCAACRCCDCRTGAQRCWRPKARWNLTPRWALIGFVGGGRAWGTNTKFSEGADTVSKGVGVRYLIARRLGLYMGIDGAWSRQDRAFYIQIGSAWR